MIPSVIFNRQTPHRGRVAALDVARGVSLVCMALYHISWDAAYFGLAPGNFPSTPAMRFLSHSVAALFLLIAGVSLALAYPDRLIESAIWRRLAKIAAAAVIVSVVTYLIAPDEAIWFGILHCILAATLLAISLYRISNLSLSAVALALLLVPTLVTCRAFETPLLVWIGLGVTPPRTLDWRPLAPWAGFLLLGLAAARSQRGRRTIAALSEWRPHVKSISALAWGGRHSLALYLVHQPVLLGIIWLATASFGSERNWTSERFEAACFDQCEAVAGQSERCRRACTCIYRGIAAKSIAVDILKPHPSAKTMQIYSELVAQCGPRIDP